MAFIDEIKLHVKAGDGGNGVERWRHEKGRALAGPSGGDGGKGGDVYAVATRDVHMLGKYLNSKEFYAENGDPGAKNSLHGKNGEDMFLEFPVGSIITNLKNNESLTLTKDGEKVLLLKGGIGGFGNEYFKRSTNRSPTEWTPGKPGEETDFHIELELFADMGLIGFPNAGKSSLLNAFTKAKAKIGDYPFTTLDPNLGVLFGFVIADIPGLIEGASEGRGLGHKFLKHTKRTKVLAHLISCENENVIEAYKTIREELKKFDSELAEKREMVIITKTDLVDGDRLKKEIKEISNFNKDVFSVSLYDDNSIKDLQDEIVKILREEDK